jgi:hypothetical protein
VIRLLAAAAVAVVVAIVALVLRRRRRPDVPTQPRYRAPTQLDRSDFPRPQTEWLVAVFSSATCEVCADVVRKAEVLACADVAVVDAEYTAQRALHQRYAIEAVPTVVVADGVGVVRASFLGPVSATDLWAAVAELRAPGSSPEPDLGRHAAP